jgi:hypothetical protein
MSGIHNAQIQCRVICRIFKLMDWRHEIIREIQQRCKISECSLSRAIPRHVDAPGRLVICHPFKQIFFEIFQPGTRMVKLIQGVYTNCG